MPETASASRQTFDPIIPHVGANLRCELRIVCYINRVQRYPPCARPRRKVIRPDIRQDINTHAHAWFFSCDTTMPLPLAPSRSSSSCERTLQSGRSLSERWSWIYLHTTRARCIRAHCIPVSLCAKNVCMYVWTSRMRKDCRAHVSSASLCVWVCVCVCLGTLRNSRT